MKNSIHQLLISKKLFFCGILLSLALMTLDLYSKLYFFNLVDALAKPNFDGHQAIEVTSFFNLVKVWNKGVSFGMLSSFNAKIFIIVLNLAIIAALLIWLFKNNKLYITAALSLILGGAFGNLVDRIINHAVADFLDFHIFGYHWPAFNVADSCVFIGVCLLLLENFFTKFFIKSKNEK